MDPLAHRVVARFLRATQDDDEPRSAKDGVLFESDLNELVPEEKAHWKGYSVRLNQATYSAEEWEDGDTADRTQHEKAFLTLEALAKHLEPMKWEKWLDRREGVLDGKPKKDRKGGVTQADATIERKDNMPLNHEEAEFLASRLKIKS